VDILFYLFGNPDDSLNLSYMYHVMNRHYATGLRTDYQFNKPEIPKSYLSCVRDCMSKYTKI